MKWLILKHNLLRWDMLDDVSRDFLYEIKFYFFLFQVKNPPRLDTIENTMKLSSMLIQSLWNTKSPLLQLPHITESHLRFFETKKV
jgi:hypothetical protein